MTSPFSFTAKTDGVDDHLAAHVNALQNAADVLAKSHNGFMFNGRIAVSVASNDITVALKTYDNGDPSASDPVYVRVNNTIRTVTAALSVTKIDGTNWFNSGAAEMAANEVDYFVYLLWNTNETPDAMSIAFSRIPYGRVYADFSVTSTNPSYLAFYGGSPASTDDCVLIGRFAASLSGAAAHLWSVPTFTNKNLIQEPIFETRVLTYAPAWASSGTQPAIGNGTNVAQYQVVGRNCKVRIRVTAGSTSTYGTGGYSFAVPLAAMTFTNGGFRQGTGIVYDASATTVYAGIAFVSSVGTSVSLTTHSATTAVSATVPVTLTTSDIIELASEHALA